MSTEQKNSKRALNKSTQQGGKALVLGVVVVVLGPVAIFQLVGAIFHLAQVVGIVAVVLLVRR